MQDAYLIWLENRGLAQRTIQEYMRYFDRLQPHLPLNQKSSDAFIHENNNKMARAALKSYIEFMTRQEYDKELIYIDIPKLKQRKRTIKGIITPEDLPKIESAMKSAGAKLMLYLSFYAGLRASELFKLYRDDFNWEEWIQDSSKDGVMTIRKSKGDKDREVIVKSMVMKKIADWINSAHEFFKENEPLFPKYVKERSKVRHWQLILARASKEGLGRRIHPHLLRHSYATWLINNGVPIETVQRQLGHEDISTTQIYTQVSKEKIRADLAKV